MSTETGGQLGMIWVSWVIADFAGMQKYSSYFKIVKVEIELF